MDKLFIPGDILLPKAADMPLWSVIACDQYTSQPEYWDELRSRVGDVPSTLHLMLPEAYLEIKDTAGETEKINREMERYLKEGIFETLDNSFIYVEREMTVGETRRGLVGLIDLEAYDYSASSVSPIHATEGTVESRLPPRVKVREGACLELPHIVVFVDDPENTVFSGGDWGEKVYDFELMDGGGHIVGRRVCGERAKRVENALSKLSEPEYLEKRYKLGGKAPVIIAMGDGNHSLATAKLCWEQMKCALSPDERKSSPARFALAELVNIHDPSVIFEPIHRVIFETENDSFIAKALEYFAAEAGEGEGLHNIEVLAKGRRESICVRGLTIGSLIAAAQSFCEEYIKNHGGRLDYIHDNDTAADMSCREGCCGIMLPAMNKDELFPSIIQSGVFPAKSFSIGPARDKRYYLECRKIR